MRGNANRKFGSIRFVVRVTRQAKLISTLATAALTIFTDTNAFPAVSYEANPNYLLAKRRE
jgi:hypothetical protein